MSFANETSDLSEKTVKVADEKKDWEGCSETSSYSTHRKKTIKKRAGFFTVNSGSSSPEESGETLSYPISPEQGLPPTVSLSVPDVVSLLNKFKEQEDISAASEEALMHARRMALMDRVDSKYTEDTGFAFLILDLNEKPTPTVKSTIFTYMDSGKTLLTDTFKSSNDRFLALSDKVTCLLNSQYDSFISHSLWSFVTFDGNFIQKYMPFFKFEFPEFPRISLSHFIDSLTFISQRFKSILDTSLFVFVEKYTFIKSLSMERFSGLYEATMKIIPGFMNFKGISLDKMTCYMVTVKGAISSNYELVFQKFTSLYVENFISFVDMRTRANSVLENALSEVVGYVDKNTMAAREFLKNKFEKVQANEHFQKASQFAVDFSAANPIGFWALLILFSPLICVFGVSAVFSALVGIF